LLLLLVLDTHDTNNATCCHRSVDTTREEASAIDGDRQGFPGIQAWH
jgi:hypothetical protein